MNRLKLYTTLKGTFPWLISIVCISICVTLYYQISKEADDSTEATKGSSSHTLYEELMYRGQRQLYK